MPTYITDQTAYLRQERRDRFGNRFQKYRVSKQYVQQIFLKSVRASRPDMYLPSSADFHIDRSKKGCFIYTAKEQVFIYDLHEMNI